MNQNIQFYLIAVLFFAVSCNKSEFENQEFINEKLSQEENIIQLESISNSTLSSAKIKEINAKLSLKRVNYRVAKAELITLGQLDNIKNIVISKDVGNKQLDFDFVPGDLRRTWSGDSGTKITYSIDHTNDIIPRGGILSKEQGINAIEKAFKTWNDIKQTNLNLTETDALNEDIGVVAFTENSNGSYKIFSDIQIAGWGDMDFNPGILAVTFTFSFVDKEGNFTDINNDKKYDVAFREIYFDPSYSWTNDGITGIDVETIAVHEIGHGLSQAHFGKVSIDVKKNRMKITPRAVMNAYYLESYRILQSTDLAGHYSIWSTWP